MATQVKLPNIELSGITDQFKNLNFKEPGQWALAPKILAWSLVAIAVVGAAYAAVLMGAHEELDNKRNMEPTLKADYRSKYMQAVNLAELQKQKLQVEEYVTQLEKQLPGKAEMDALLSDINQAGLGRGLQFELWRPGQVAVRDYYAELPIAIKVTGKYHDVGSFAADVANLSRIVTLHDMNIQQATSNDKKLDMSGQLVMEAVARTYRYLDPAEVAAARDAAKKAAAAKNPAKPAAPAAATGAKK
jgi:type IV pilus assembly protein PilO